MNQNNLNSKHQSKFNVINDKLPRVLLFSRKL